MQSAPVLETVDEELAHISLTARWDTHPVEESFTEFNLIAITHRVSRIGDIQCFWPLDDLSQVRRDIQASIEEQSGEQTLIFQYRAQRCRFHESVALTMEDGSTRTATWHAGRMDMYDVTYSFVYFQNRYPAVSANMLAAAIQAGNLTLLKATIKTANHLNMGIDCRPIHLAINYNQPHILEWLVAQPRIDVNKTPLGSTRPTVQHLFRRVGVTEEQEHFHMQCLCTLLRVGMSVMDEDPCTEYRMFHWLAGTSESNITYLMGQEDIVQKLLEYAAYAFEPGKKTGRPAALYNSMSPVFTDFLRRAEKVLWLAVSAYMPVSALTTVIVSYICK